MKAVKIFLLVATMLMIADFAFAQTWTQTSAPDTNEWISVVSSADGIKLAAAVGGIFDPGLIYVSTNSGTCWKQTSAPTNYWNALASSADGTKLVAVAFGQINNEYGGGLIFTSTNSGGTWTATSAPTNYWNSVASSADGIKLAATSDNSIYVSANSGFTWTPTCVPTNGWYSITSSANGAKLAAVAVGGIIFTSTNSGIAWATNGAHFGGPSRSITSSADGNKLISVAPTGPALIGETPSGGIYVSKDFGATWTTNNIFGAWETASSSADGSKLVAGTGDGLIYISTDSGITWMLSTNLGPNETIVSIASSSDGDKLVLVVNDGGIWTSQTMPSPQLNLASSNTNLALSWTIPSTNFVLQQSSDLISWSDVTNAPALNPTNLQNQVMLPPSNSSGFYRLKTP
jgi:hypothetical protein